MIMTMALSLGIAYYSDGGEHAGSRATATESQSPISAKSRFY
jgi:hypothetical protein